MKFTKTIEATFEVDESDFAAWFAELGVLDQLWALNAFAQCFDDARLPKLATHFRDATRQVAAQYRAVADKLDRACDEAELALPESARVVG